MVLVYGSRNSEDHAFKEYLLEVSSRYENIHVINIYSQPMATDKQGVDFHQAGYVDIELLKQIFPNNQCQFRITGRKFHHACGYSN